MTPDVFRRFKALPLVKHTLELSEDTLLLQEWRRDPQTGTILHGIFFVETLLTLTGDIPRHRTARGHSAPGTSRRD